MTRVERNVVRLADRAADRVELGERLGEPREVLEVCEGRLAALEPVTDERAAVDRREDHVVAADVHAPLRVARLEVELPWRLRDLLEQEVGVELDALLLDVLPCLSKELESLVAQELDPELGDDPPPSAVERRDGLLGKDLVPRHAVDQHIAS